MKLIASILNRLHRMTAWEVSALVCAGAALYLAGCVAGMLQLLCQGVPQ